MQELGFLDCFEDLKDPRHSSYTMHPIEEILFTTLCAVICGAEGWEDIEEFGKAKEEWLKTYLAYENGIPSDDTFRRFFRRINPEDFQKCFIEWIKSMNLEIKDKVVAIDSKTSRRTHDGETKALHMVSAFASEARLVLGQQKCFEKSNEITAIPKLIELLDVKGSIVSIDAMGCQKKIAKKIVEKEGDYIFGLKGNQGLLHDDVKLFFGDERLTKNLDFHKTTDVDHGRIEIRKCTVTEDIDWLKECHDWDGLRSIVKIESEVIKNNKTTNDVRYYITSLSANPQKIGGAIRSHWAIENSLHWVLDMSFNDDFSRIRKENAPQNMAIIKHFALNMVRKIQKKRQSIKRLRKQAGWNSTILDMIIQQKIL